MAWQSIESGFIDATRQVRVGYISLLLIIDALFVIVPILDLIEASALGISLSRSAVEGFSKPSRLAILTAVGILVCGLILLPIVLALYRVRFAPLLTSKALLRKGLGSRGAMITLTHVLFVFAMASTAFLLEGASRLSGPMATVSLAHPRTIVQITPAFTATLFSRNLPIAFLTVLAPLVWMFRDLTRKDPEPWHRSYFRVLALADLRSDLYPAAGRHGRNFNAGGPGPALRGAQRRQALLASEYQHRLTRERGAKSYLDEQGSWCCSQLSKLICDATGRQVYKVGLLPSTSRALEAAIRSCPRPRALFLSPYEHPVERALCDDLRCSDDATSMIDAPIGKPGLCDLPWQEQLAIVGKALQESMQEVQAKAKSTPVLLISDVNWATGHRIPVDDLVTSLSIPNLIVIVDGAHSLGNAGFKPLSSGSKADFYVGSAHKWLLASEPMGILAYRNQLSCDLYDLWRDQVSRCTASIGSIASLRSVIELRQKYQSDFQTHSDLLRQYLEVTAKEMEIVGSNNGLAATNLVSLRPARSRYEWKYQSRETLDRALNASGTPAVRANVVQFASESVPWIRLGLYHYHDASDVDALLLRIRALIQPVAQD